MEPATAGTHLLSQLQEFDILQRGVNIPGRNNFTIHITTDCKEEKSVTRTDWNESKHCNLPWATRQVMLFVMLFAMILLVMLSSILTSIGIWHPL